MQDRLIVDEYSIARFRPPDDDELGSRSVHLIRAFSQPIGDSSHLLWFSKWP
jgi:hypothetical protein